MTTTSQALATRDGSPAGLVQQYKADFAAVLPTHIRADTWVRLATGALRRNPRLAEAAANNHGAFLGALLEAARLGLEPGTEQFYLTPRMNKKTGKEEVLGIVGYRGEVELIYRAGAVSSVIVEVVRERDKFTYAPGRDERPLHEIDWDSEDRGGLRLAYAYARMKDGATSKVVVLNKHHIAAAKKMSQGADKPYSPWVQHEEAMWMKTAAHRLARWVPMSPEYMREQMRAKAQVEANPTLSAMPPPIEESPVPDFDPETGEVLEGELLPPESAA